MHIQVSTKEFTEAIARAEKITGKNLSLPVLRCVLLVAGSDTLTIRATNLDIGLEIRVPAIIKKEGVLAVPGDVLHSFLSNVHDAKVELREDAGNINVSFGDNTTLIKTYPSEDFPILPKVTEGVSFTLEPSVLVRGLKSVWYSAASSSIKPELSSVYVYADTDSLMFAATDSFRLAEKKVSAKNSGDFESFLLPTKNVGELIRNLDGVQKDVTITYNDNQAVFSWGDVYVTSRVIDGTFPDYTQLIPKDFTTEAIVLKQEFIEALKLGAIFSNTYQQIKFFIDPQKKSMTIQTSNADVGENTVAVDAALSGESVAIHFNHRYISDALQSIPGDSVSLSFNGIGKPLVVRGVGDTSFTYLVMPMNR